MLSAAKWGALVGAAIYLVTQIVSVIQGVALGGATADPNHPGVIALGCLQLFAIIFAFSTSGFFAGRETRQAGYGAIAGMITFVVYGALISIYSFGGRFQPGRGGGTVGQQIVIGLISLVLMLGISALIGWLGGRPGASRGKAQAARPSLPDAAEPPISGEPATDSQAR